MGGPPPVPACNAFNRARGHTVCGPPCAFRARRIAWRVHKIPLVAALVLFGAGIAAAQNMLAGPSTGLTVERNAALTRCPGVASARPDAEHGRTEHGAPAAAPVTTPATPSTTPSTSPGTSTPPTTGGASAVEQIVALTRTVDAGAPVTAFTVPAGRATRRDRCVVTNPGTAPSCGARDQPASGHGGDRRPGRVRAPGMLCVPAQTSLNLGLARRVSSSPLARTWSSPTRRAGATTGLAFPSSPASC